MRRAAPSALHVHAVGDPRRDEADARVAEQRWNRDGTRRGSRVISVRCERPFVVGEVQLREAGAVRHHHGVSDVDAVFLGQDDLTQPIVLPHPVAGATQRMAQRAHSRAARRARRRRGSERQRRRIRCPRRSSRPVERAASGPRCVTGEDAARRSCPTTRETRRDSSGRASCRGPTGSPHRSRGPLPTRTMRSSSAIRASVRFRSASAWRLLGPK